MKKCFTFFIFTISFLLLLFISNTNAQSIRKVLIEQGTNTSCGPCASQNPSFQEWIGRNVNRIVPVIYHAWWPGKTDPMYTYDTAMQATRIRYYGIDSRGVPCGVMSGHYLVPTGTYYEGAVGDTAAWSTGLAGQSFYSPIGITITLTQTNGTGNVKVDVTSTAKFINKKLRIVICEQHHSYANAPNGETDFYFLARKMLPDYNGVDISLNANETKSFTYDFSVDASFSDDLYVVAFVQDEGTKDVLQAESTLDNPAPKEPDFSAFVNQFDMVFIGKKDDTYNMDVVLKNTTNTDATYMLNAFKSTQTPSDWKAEVIDNKYVVPISAKSSEKVTVKFTIGSTAGIGEVNLNVQLQGQSISFETNKLIGISDAIESFHVLGGAATHSVLPMIVAKRGQGKIFDISAINLNNSLSKLTNVKTIVWDGSTDGTPSTGDAATLKQAINSGIGVLVLGGNIASGVVNNGVMQLLNTSYIAHCQEGYGSSPWPVTLAGVSKDPISKDFGYTVNGHLINWLLPLFKINNSQTTFPVMAFAKSQDSIFAIRTQLTNSRAVVLGINPFVILDKTIRENLVNRSLEWIEYTLNDVEFENAINSPTLEASVSPNPFTDKIQLTFKLNTRKDVRIVVTNELGQEIKAINDFQYNEGTNTIELNLSELCTGHYFVVINSLTGSVTVPIEKMK